ncbi:Flp family type IVb pilin [Pseudarthrobacter sp. Y6]|uniref:Flp family type IVb pilin n=1 Tax=Pseudarthrobacter sp. Y6 TaxID=3418422 RepID=UPI003CF98E36
MGRRRVERRFHCHRIRPWASLVIAPTGLCRVSSSGGVVPGLTLFQAVGQCAFVDRLRNNLSSEAGATAVEYSLLVAFIATVIIGSVGALGNQLIPGFQSVIDGL